MLTESRAYARTLLAIIALGAVALPLLLSLNARAASLEIVSTPQGNSACSGALLSSILLGIEDAPLTNPSDPGGALAYNWENTTPYPSGFAANPEQYCFEFHRRETQPNGNTNPGGSYVPYQRWYGNWYSGTNTSSYTPISNVTVAGNVTVHAQGKSAITFENQWCETTYTPPSCTTYGAYNVFDGKRCSGGSIIESRSGTHNWFTGQTSGSPVTSADEAYYLCADLSASCCQHDYNTTWRHGEPHITTYNFAAFDGGTLVNSSWPDATGIKHVNVQQCTGGNTVSCVPASQGTDLTAGAVAPTSGTEGSFNFSATISNSGNATPAGFQNRWQLDNNADHSAVTETFVHSISAVGTGGTAVTSATRTLTTGTWYLRVCADTSTVGVGAIDELDETNNCGPWTTVTVSAVIPPQCSDGLDNDGDGLEDTEDPACHTDGNPNNPGSHNPNDDDESPVNDLPECSDGINNDGVNGTDYPTDPGCTSASDDNESTPIPVMTFTITDRVRPQERASITWSTTSAKPGSCTVRSNANPPDQWTGESGSELSSVLTNETIFTLRCLDLADNATTTTRTVRIAPSSGEE